ncbi:Uncharacterised protein [Kluyvera cryocrescens]|uniref:Phage Tail Collar Domain n=1 Tax=Kluyvera cryocrescens TaxID=580 RepID=A0A485BS20_KLUCR|nr:Uncharacterised protein [Kluyvera cryocrescens]
MSKIERYQGNVQAFASSAQGVERTVFGETTQANDLTSQITAAFLRGWGIVGPSEHPSLEDFNGAMYALSQFIAYQHQAGIPEWHEEQEYYAGSVCTHTGVAYQSIEDANTGNEPPSAHWTPVITSRNGSEYFQSINATLTALATLAGTKDKMPYFSGEDTAALTALTAFAREILAQTDAAGVLLKLRLGAGAPAIGIPFFWPSAAMPNTVMDEWSDMVFLKWNGATFSATEYPKLALVIPGLRLNDVRGEFIRVWDDGRGVDIGRTLLSAQESSKLHEHLGQNGSAPNYGYMTVASPDSVAWDNGWSVGNIPNFSSGSAGSNLMGMRPRNVAFNFLVRAK